MRISFELNVKVVLAVVAVGAMSVGSFFAGRRYQVHAEKVHAALAATDADPYAAIAKPIKAGDTLIIPDREASDSEASWCKAHPDTKWTFGPLSAKAAKTLNAQIPGGSAEIKPITGICDSNGHAWKDVLE